MAQKRTAPRRSRPRAASYSAPLEAALEATRRVLDDEQRPFALIGGLAVAVRATPRFTHDVDFALSCSDAEAEALVGSFVRRGFRMDALLMTKSTNRIATVRLIPPGSDVLVDLLFDFTGIENEIVSMATQASLSSGVRMAVATRAHLIAMKVLAFRDKDKVDLTYLLEVATKAELAEARRALRAIAIAGKEPKRALIADLDRLVAQRKLDSSEFIKVPKSKWPTGWSATEQRAAKKRAPKKS